MANRYAITGQENAVTSSLTTALDLVGSATARPEIDFFMGSAGAGTLADQSVRCTLMRHTTVNTLTGVTPQPIDPNAPAAVSTAGENASAEGTYTSGSELVDQAVHLRSQIVWWASSEAGRLVVPATANNGIGFRVIQASGAYAGPWDYTAHFVGP